MFSSRWINQINALDPNDDAFLNMALALIHQLDPSALENPASLKIKLTRLIAKLDEVLSDQLSVILHHDDFQRLEASWRNLYSIASLPVTGQRARVKLLDISWQEIARDLNTSVSVERSCLYNFIGNRELNTLGGEPFGMFVVDHSLSMEMDYDDEFDDLYTLELLARLGEICLCPFTLTIADDFFGESGAGWLSDVKRVGKIINGPDFQGWRRMKTHPSMKFIGLAMPKIKLRERYKHHRIGFVFDEAQKAQSGLWGSAAYPFASIVIREYGRLGWFGFMKSRWQDKYQGALVNAAENSNLAYSLVSPTPDVQLFGNIARFYAESGFIPLCHSPITDKYFFFGNHSTWQPENKDVDKVASQIQAILMSCRIAHYLKVQIRNMIGSFHTVSECQKFLTDWIDNYSSNLVEADEKTLAKYPLSKGKVKVREVEDGIGGRFMCELTMQPQYQFDHYCGEILLSTDLGNLPIDQAGTHL